MTQRASEFRAEDFFLDDAALRKRHRMLFALLAGIRRHSVTENSVLTLDFDLEIESSVRRFTVNTQVPVKSPGDLSVRYTQQKKKQKVVLKNFFNSDSNAKPLVGSFSQLRSLSRSTRRGSRPV
jgi:hypothetical protein